MKTTFIAALSAIALSVLLTSYAEAGVIRSQGGANRDYVPTGKGWGVPDLSPPEAKGGKPGGGGGGGTKTSTSNGINYHGGPVLGTGSAGTNVYYIWYGNWSGNTAPSILDNLASSIGGSPYFNINTTYYYNNSNTPVINSVTLAGSTSVGYTYGTALSDSNIQSIVTDAISTGALPKDSNGVYMVLTSKDVQETSGFCSRYCGWHTHATITSLGGMDTKFAFIGDASQQCPSSCSVQNTTSPNGNTGADAMASVIAHELEEAVTDPDLNAWYDHRGYENADKCAWKFGTTYKVSSNDVSINGSSANMNLGGMDYLIQQNWVNASGGYCSLTY